MIACGVIKTIPNNHPPSHVAYDTVMNSKTDRK